MNRPQSSSASLDLESQLCFALYSTLHAVEKAYADLLPALGLTYPQYLVMLVLWQGDDVGVKHLGERLHLDSGTLTPVLKRLETAGFVHRRRDPVDERQVRITLTEAGRDLQREAVCVPARMGETMGLSAEKLGRLRDDLLALRATLTARRGTSGRRRGATAVDQPPAA